jgi:hypothetical protein
VSVIHLVRGLEHIDEPRRLDGCVVTAINSRLWPVAELAEAERLRANAGMGRLGVRIDGVGFLIDAPEYADLTARDPANAQLLRPYLGGDELNQEPTMAPCRWVIDFGARTLEECQAWPLALAIVEARVRPERERKFPAWWRFDGGERFSKEDDEQVTVLAATIYTKHLAFSLQPPHVLLNSKIFVVRPGSYALFAILQSRVHSEWAWLMSSTLKQDLAYSATDCFETFPFPAAWARDEALADAGRTYHAFRASMMQARSAGLTAIYNRFHDPDEHDADVLTLRELQDAIDRCVLARYGWSDLAAPCAFGVAADQAEEDGDRQRARPKPWRYRWQEEMREQVLARLLSLNGDRAHAERALRESSEPRPKGPKKATPRAPAAQRKQRRA